MSSRLGWLNRCILLAYGSVDFCAYRFPAYWLAAARFEVNQPLLKCPPRKVWVCNAAVGRGCSFDMKTPKKLFRCHAVSVMSILIDISDTISLLACYRVNARRHRCGIDGFTTRMSLLGMEGRKTLPTEYRPMISACRKARHVMTVERRTKQKLQHKQPMTDQTQIGWSFLVSHTKIVHNFIEFCCSLSVSPN